MLVQTLMNPIAGQPAFSEGLSSLALHFDVQIEGPGL